MANALEAHEPLVPSGHIPDGVKVSPNQNPWMDEDVQPDEMDSGPDKSDTHQEGM